MNGNFEADTPDFLMWSEERKSASCQHQKLCVLVPFIHFSTCLLHHTRAKLRATLAEFTLASCGELE